jgi:CBS domain-containing protein
MQSLKVVSYMNSHPVIFDGELSIAEAVEHLLEKQQTGGPVVDSAGKVIGFISERDCLEKMLTSSYYREQVARVKDVMRTDVLSVSAQDSIIEIAQMMVGQKPKVYPVVDESSKLIGTITRRDVLYAMDVQLHEGYKDVV